MLLRKELFLSNKSATTMQKMSTDRLRQGFSNFLFSDATPKNNFLSDPIDG